MGNNLVPNGLSSPLFEIDVSEIVGHEGDEPDGVVDFLDAVLRARSLGLDYVQLEKVPGLPTPAFYHHLDMARATPEDAPVILGEAEAPQSCSPPSSANTKR